MLSALHVGSAASAWFKLAWSEPYPLLLWILLLIILAQIVSEVYHDNVWLWYVTCQIQE